MGVQLRALGTTATYAPIIKRAAHRLSGGRSVLVVPDTNRSDANGDDVTGTAKIFIYVSTDATRTAYALDETYTPAVAPSSSSIAFMGSSTTRENDNLYVVYQGTDNSLRLITFTWGGSSYGAGSEQTIIAANAVTNRFRAVDIDALPTNSSLGVVVYEASASTGQGAYVRTYVRLTDDTTWIKAFEHQIFTTQFIKDGSADVSISWDRGGATANVAKFAIYYTQAHTAGDGGDYLRELSFNVASGTTNSASSVGAWYTNLNQNIAYGTRRGFLFPEAAGKYVFGGCAGTTTPRFQAMRIRTGTYTGLTVNQTSVAVQPYFRIIIRRDNNPYTAITADYSDGRLAFAHSGLGVQSSNYMARMQVFRFDEANLDNLSAYVDTFTRPADSGYNLSDGVIGIYGGGTKYNYSSQYALNFSSIYGSTGNTVSAVANILSRKIRAFTEDSMSAPTLLNPLSNPSVDKPTLRAEFQNSTLYTNALAKVHWQFANDSGFSTNVRNIIQPDSAYQSYSSDGSVQPTRIITYDWPSDVSQLIGGTWYVRCRMVDDLGGVSAWSVDDSFILTHPPTALPLRPVDNAVAEYVTGDTYFSWNFVDTEPSDSQTAYQLVVVRTDTGATVHDTGKVASSATNAWIDLAGTLRGLPLQWTVSLWDEDDNQGPFSNAYLFTLLDNPIVVITSPVDAVTVTTAIPTVAWSFTADAGRTQRAYRVTVYHIDPSPDELVGDSGWIVSGDTSYTFAANILENGENYRFIVEVQDSTGLFGSTADNILGNYEFEADARGWTVTGGTIAQSTALAHNGVGSLLLDPTGGTDAIATSDYVPCVIGVDYEASAWFNMPAGYAGNVIFRVKRYDAAGSLIGSVSTTVTPVVAATWTQISRTYTTVAGDIYLGVEIEIDGTPLTTDLLYLDQVSLVQEQVEADTDWIAPDLGDGSLTQDEFRVTISWTDANLDPEFVAWRVYRRYMEVADAAIDFNATASTWVLIHQTTDNGAALSYEDFNMPLNRTVDYVVVQMVDRFGSLIESDITSYQTITTTGDRYFFVPETPIGAVASFEASSVNADNFLREVEQEKIHIIDRGRQVQVGDDLGYDGALTVRLRSVLTSRRDREFFEYLSTQDAPNTYLKSPFGDVLLVKIGQISTVRIPGVGTTDMVDLTIPYSQVFTDVPVTRTI